MKKVHNDIKWEFINNLIAKTSFVVEDLQVNKQTIIKKFFNFFKKETKIQNTESINFWEFDSIKTLWKIKKILLEKRKNCKNKYKKLHYTYIISRIEDRILEIKYNHGKTISWIEKLFYIIEPGDLMLISYNLKWKTLNSILNKIANSALKHLSKSIFVHIGIIWEKNQDTWFDWIHSTLHNDWGRTWVKKLPLKEYLSMKTPSILLIMRYKEITKDKQKKIINEWIKHVENKTNYDTWRAIWDLTGLNILRRRKKAFNCWELVYNCLKVIDSNLQIKKKALPASYIDNKYMEQIYLTKIN